MTRVLRPKTQAIYYGPKIQVISLTSNQPRGDSIPIIVGEKRAYLTIDRSEKVNVLG